MCSFLLRIERLLLLISAVGLAGNIVWWTSLTYSAWMTREFAQQISNLRTERDEALANSHRLRSSAAELMEAQAKLAASRRERSQNLELPVRPHVVASEISTGLMKSPGPPSRPVAQTGSIGRRDGGN
jgi:hypothetical protein